VVGAVVGAVVSVARGAGVKVVIGEGTGVGVEPGAIVNGGRVGGTTTTAALHMDVKNLSLINVTVPFRANALPSTVTLSASVMDVSAMIVPTMEEPVPRSAELPICQKTLHGLPPLMKTTELDDAVVRLEAAWKIQTEFGSF
jgi:hypothetical protein